jgi:hypothetical protein
MVIILVVLREPQGHSCIKRSTHPVSSTCPPRSPTSDCQMPGLSRFSKVPERLSAYFASFCGIARAPSTRRSGLLG